MALIGIDLGTTNSLAAVYRNGTAELIPNSLGTFLTPSVVGLDDEGNICVGAVAKERIVSHFERTAASFKRFMGTDRIISLGDKSFTPQELSSFVLRQLKEDAEKLLGEEVTEAVISVPAYFNDNQRQATKEAGLLAGFKVERLINEPSAAALSSRQEETEEDQSYLVFDFGGGTLDISIVDCFENVVEIIAVSGDNHLGGNDFDMLIAEHFCKKHGFLYDNLEPQNQATLLRKAEKCKKELTEKSVGLIQISIRDKEYALFLTNPELVQICYGLFGRMSSAVDRALRDSGKTIDDIDEVVMVGGSSKMPIVTYYLKNHLDMTPVMIGSPDEVVALGAGVFAGIKERNEEIKDMVLTDICPFTLGINIVNYLNHSKCIMSPIIERNSILPTSKRAYYTNSYNNQQQISIGIYQGEAYYCDENLNLGEIEMEIAKMPKGRVVLEVCFSYDINGILEVEVMDHNKGEQKQKVLVDQNIRMSEEEIAKRLEILNTYKMQPAGGEIAKLVLARGERLFAELIGEKREKVASIIKWLGRAIASTSDQDALKICQEAMLRFDELED